MEMIGGVWLALKYCSAKIEGRIRREEIKFQSIQLHPITALRMFQSEPHEKDQEFLPLEDENVDISDESIENDEDPDFDYQDFEEEPPEEE